jgi:hypothetical protein
MSVTRNIIRSTQYANGATISSSYTLTGLEEYNLSALVPASATTQYEYAFTDTDVVAFSAIAQAAGLTLKWNSSGSPVSPMVLPAGVSADWDSTKYGINNTIFPNPFQANVTTLYVTNSQAVAIQLDISTMLSA